MSTDAAEELRPITSLVAACVVRRRHLWCGRVLRPFAHETLSTFTVIAGIFLLIDGLLAIFGSVFGKGEGRGLLALIGVLSAIAGLVLIKKPFDTLMVFTLIVGVWFVVAGVVRFVAALASPEGRGGNIVTAILDVIAGIVILSWPDLSVDARRDHRHRPDCARSPFHRRRLATAQAGQRCPQRSGRNRAGLRRQEWQACRRTAAGHGGPTFGPRGSRRS